jgi:hypothetical protein
LVGSTLNGCGDSIGPFFSKFQLVPAYKFLGHIGIPDMMEICLDTIKSDLNSVSPSVESLIVKRLVDISKELTDSF